MFKSVLICVYLWLLTMPVMPIFQAPQFDLLIKRGRVVDGSGRAGYVADLGIKGDRIVSIGDLSKAAATRTIDAQGLVVAPGFIDMLGQSELTILVDPRLPSKIYQGITTEIIGDAAERARRENASLLLIRLNTPGGLYEATRETVQKIVSSPVPALIPAQVAHS